ncbi:MAG: hypothetical protein JRI36_06395 [Deltaproteobacteria bacterium]|nr:hypothetical protein [Deltaproteobacteria bacterium]
MSLEERFCIANLIQVPSYISLMTALNYYEITDARIEHYMVLVEIRSSHFPKRLNIEVRREPRDCDFEHKIAYSRLAPARSW